MKMKPMHDSHEFSSDAPKLIPNEDELDRSGFSKEIARALTNWHSNESLVVSLCGEWGSGKTTLCNFIKYYLKKADPDVLMVDFNPWEWSGQEKVFEGFFRQIGSVFGKTDRKRKTRRLYNLWIGLGRKLKPVEVVASAIPKSITPAVGLAAISALGFGNAFQVQWLTAGAYVLGAIACLVPLMRIPETMAKNLQDLPFDETLDDIREEIAHELLKVKKPIIVFIDDIDRLTDSEIALLFQLVKANVNLPNIVFFLMYQKSVVTNALKNIVSEDGAKYLRKIVQVEWETPAPNNDLIRSILVNNLHSILDKDQFKFEWDKNRWDRVFWDGLWPYFENLRDIKRFLGSFKFHLKSQLRNNVLEVNPIDLMAIEVLRMFDNPAYLTLSKGNEWGAEKAMTQFMGREKAFESAKSKLEALIKQEKRTAAKEVAITAILQNLFPSFYGYQNNDDGFLRDLRICHPDHFHKYFRGSLDLQNAVASKWHDFLGTAGDREKTCINLRSAIRSEKLEELLTHLFAARDKISSNNLLSLITALFDVSDEFPKGNIGRGLFDSELTAFRFIHFRLLLEPVGSRIILIKKAISETTGFSLVLRFISHEDSATRRRRPEIDYVLPPSETKWIEETGLSLIRNHAAQGILLKDQNAALALFCWQNWSNQEEVAKWAHDFAAIPTNALSLLNTLILSSGTEEPLFVANNVEPFIDLTFVKAKIDRIPPSELTDLDKKTVLLLKTAIGRKNAKLPYAQIRLSDCPEAQQ